ncbi:MAG TPA: sigma-70 family RNA polymerase sigma factor [Longimicrobiaceae bacterium]|nr:sigma-70 family RNA polymerase sigma factor [Longimicrobiaceae bacterium]
MAEPRSPKEAHRVDAEELELMARVKRGDLKAFDALVDRLWPRTFLYAQHLTHDRERADDIAQECFSRLWQRKDDWELSGAVGAWLFRTARNLVISEARKARVRQRWAWVHHEQAVPPRSALEEVEINEMRDAVEQAIRQLPERRREVFSLFHLHGMSHREIAEILEIRPQSVANHLHRALTDLRVALKDYFPRLAPADGSSGEPRDAERA